MSLAGSVAPWLQRHDANETVPNGEEILPSYLPTVVLRWSWWYRISWQALKSRDDQPPHNKRDIVILLSHDNIFALYPSYLGILFSLFPFKLFLFSTIVLFSIHYRTIVFSFALFLFLSLIFWFSVLKIEYGPVFSHDTVLDRLFD